MTKRYGGLFHILIPALGLAGGCSAVAEPSVLLPPPPRLPISVSALTPPVGPSAGGITLTLTGENFLPGAQVTFAGVASPQVSVDSSSQITAVLPASPNTQGPITVVVDNQNGDRISRQDLFAYYSSHIDFWQVLTFQEGDPTSVITADFNMDGQPDFATAMPWDGYVGISLGAGRSQFSGGGYPLRVFADKNPMALAVGDFNQDAKPDLVVANSGSSSISLLLGDGTGKFGAPASFPVGGSPSWVVAADFNGDKALDLAVTNRASNTVSVLLGNGLGGFGAPSDFPVGLWPSALVAGDLNGDKVLDLIVANNGSNTISVLLGNGRGGFGASSDFSVGLGPSSLAMADFNGDLKLDLVITNSMSTTASVLLGDGMGGFTSAADIPVGKGSSSVAAADFNGDLQTDLVIVGLGEGVALGPVSVFQGDGKGGFTAVFSENDIGPAAVAVADFDGDHLPDAVIAKQSGADAILWNQSR